LSRSVKVHQRISPRASHEARRSGTSTARTLEPRQTTADPLL
jgi:hypothetical protein